MENNSELLGWKRNQQFEKRFFTLGSRLSGWHKPQPKCLALSANGLVQGIDPRPYATSIRYWCPRNGWGFPSNGEWSNLDTIEQCEKLSYPRRLVAGGWLRCAGGASGAWPRPGHRNHPSYILGNGGGQHWRLWDRHCTCPVIAPSITCPHVASLLRTILDSLGSTAHNLIPLQCAAWNIGVSTVWSCVGVRPRYCLYDHDKTICLFVS